MSSTPLRIGASSTSPLTQEVVLRAGVALVAVLACYCFQWHWLRSATLQANLVLDSLFGVTLNHIGPESVQWNGAVYNYVASCTMADVWCGALAFIVNLRRSLGENLSRIAIFSVGLFFFNILRLSVGDLMQAHSVPWLVSHEIFAGVCYYLIWQYLWKTRTW